MLAATTKCSQGDGMVSELREGRHKWDRAVVEGRTGGQHTDILTVGATV